jgi:hypothetical protein
MHATSKVLVAGMARSYVGMMMAMGGGAHRSEWPPS